MSAYLFFIITIAIVYMESWQPVWSIFEVCTLRALTSKLVLPSFFLFFFFVLLCCPFLKWMGRTNLSVLWHRWSLFSDTLCAGLQTVSTLPLIPSVPQQNLWGGKKKLLAKPISNFSSSKITDVNVSFKSLLIMMRKGCFCLQLSLTVQCLHSDSDSASKSFLVAAGPQAIPHPAAGQQWQQSCQRKQQFMGQQFCFVLSPSPPEGNAGAGS